MQKYEILSILDPKQDLQITLNEMEIIFGKENVISQKEWEKKELAYSINKSTTAKYLLSYVNASPETIIEFERKAKLSKIIWRHMTINLSKEKINQKPRNYLIKKEKAFQEKLKERQELFNSKKIFDKERREEKNNE